MRSAVTDRNERWQRKRRETGELVLRRPKRPGETASATTATRRKGGTTPSYRSERR